MNGNFNSISVVQTLPGHKSAIRSFEFNPMGVLLASGSVDKTVKVFIYNFVFVYRAVKGTFVKIKYYLG